MRRAAAILALAMLGAVPPPSAGQVLIAKLKRLADTGRLTDSRFVAATLGVRLVARPVESPAFEQQAGYPIACAPGLRVRAGTATSYVSSDPTPLSYLVTTEHDCTGYVRLSTQTRAELDIGPVSAPACIGAADLRAWLPGVDESRGSHGELFFTYAPRGSATALSMTFTFGEACLSGLHLAQGPDLTPRFQAAQQRQRACMVPQRIAFCRRHAPFGWGDGDVQSDMDAFATRACGTLDRFFAHTPAAARPRDVGLVQEDPDHSTPCSRAEAELAALRR